MRSRPHVVILQRPTNARDSVGGSLATWTGVATVYAKVRPLTSAEQERAAQRQASTSHMVEVDYATEIASIASDWRVLYLGRVLTLDGNPINVDEANVELHLPCVEMAAA